MKLIDWREPVPKWYGITATRPTDTLIECHVIPLNVLIRWCRRVWKKIKYDGYNWPPGDELHGRVAALEAEMEAFGAAIDRMARNLEAYFKKKGGAP